MADKHDLVTVLVTDHREVEQIFTEMEQGGLEPARRRDLADEAIKELVRHAVAEEQYLYPAARAALPDGDRLADHELEEHAEAEEVMKELGGLDPTDARFDRLLRELITDVRKHIAEEEGELFPRLKAAMSPDELADLGTKIERVKKAAPTRPHPAAPDKPPANKVLAPGTGLVDRLRDAFSRRGKHN